ncbi:RTC4-like domain-containing protein [Podospora aff. communis PSN243]|uniref:Restriction of telomere capping protein 4 n=1 Tax=Podospora aff. communis PSN243 TaxID=3040156 RepID=A0AAV9GMP5_9PEZI|nr:RTC4-like domain-containing protein [Podospora aff. communis PSN243]
MYRPAARRSGLSRNEHVDSLLSTFRKKEDKESDVEDPAPRKEEPAVDAPPLDDSDSSDGVPTRGAIQRSQFHPPPKFLGASGARRANKDDQQTAGASSLANLTPATKKPGRPLRGNSGTDAEKGTGKASERKSEEASGEEEPVQSVKVKGEVLGEHLDDNIDKLVRKQAAPTIARKRNTFGGSSSASLRGKFPKNKASPKRLMAPKDLSPQKEETSSKRVLKLPGATPETKTARSAKKQLSIPCPLSERNTQTPQGPKRKIQDPVEGSKNSRPKKAKAEPESRPEPKSLKIPELFSSSFEFAEDSAPLNGDDGSPPDSTKRSISPLSEATTPTSSRPVCPMCYEVVDSALLAQFKVNRPYMTLQEEQQFCLLHKKTSAKEAWLDKGYPDISWSRLESRINEQHRFLRTILEGGKSHFGDIFSEKVKTGQNKTLLKSEESLTPGYYGGRGLRAMSENLVNNFSSLLRRRAVEDRLVSARGHTAYVQSVLVPELTVRLIMEDMDVDAEEARLIMAESKWVGELLNEEVADIVLSEEEEDSGSELSTCPDTDGP